MYDVEFRLKPSRLLNIFFCSLLCIATIILMTLPWHIAFKIIAIITTLIYGKYILQRYVWLKSPASLIALRRTADDRWLLTTHNDCYYAEILGDSTVTQLVTVLIFRSQGQHFARSCILMPDSFLDADDYRKLIVTLKLYAMTQPASRRLHAL